MQSISQLCEPTMNALLYGVTDLSDEAALYHQTGVHNKN